MVCSMNCDWQKDGVTIEMRGQRRPLGSRSGSPYVIGAVYGQEWRSRIFKLVPISSNRKLPCSKIRKVPAHVGKCCVRPANQTATATPIALQLSSLGSRSKSGKLLSELN